MTDLAYYLSQIAGQGTGWTLFVICLLVVGYLYRELGKKDSKYDAMQNKLIDIINAGKEKHLQDVLGVTRDTQEAVIEMNKAHTLAMEKATEAVQSVKLVAEQTRQTVGYILDNTRGK